jgi:hypothetical protein
MMSKNLFRARLPKIVVFWRFGNPFRRVVSVRIAMCSWTCAGATRHERREVSVQPDEQDPFIRIVVVQYFAISERYLMRLDDDLIREFG